ncbi:secretory carrier-associated membrane protein 1-like [Musca vetustissima]|uniref:secretory carrier-associated membrane protein 1-like n=1 Tax=Musca vetustissima TaxID=27455 RepID=UPI002AB787AF|nr:secretory carrier-associated membrane protein 1-like [Musca vetustissima]
MSGFDDNPFGEPNLDNPFADPAIQQATRTTTNVQSSLEDYNPFEQEQSKPQLQINSTINSNAAVVQPLSQNIPPAQQRAPAATPSTSIQITTEELQVSNMIRNIRIHIVCIALYFLSITNNKVDFKRRTN